MKDDHYPTIPLLNQIVHRSLMLQVTGLENGWKLPSATMPACLSELLDGSGGTHPPLG